MGTRDILLALHIAGAGTWFGSNIMQAVVPAMLARQGDPVVAGWYRVAAGLSLKLYTPAATWIVITGVSLVLVDGAYDFQSLFVVIGLGVVVVGAVLGRLVFQPVSIQAAEAVDAGDRAAIASTRARLAVWGSVDTLLVLFTITVMVLRLD